MFFVSLKGTCDSGFLQEAYEGSKLKEKDPLALLKERMPELAAQGKKAETIDDDNDDCDDDNEQDDDSVRDRKVRGKQIHEPGADLAVSQSERNLLAARELW